jgi:hypothetical protein
MRSTTYSPIPSSDCNDINGLLLNWHNKADKPVLLGESARVFARVNTYIADLPSVGRIGAIGLQDPTKSAYYKLYDSEAKSVTAIKSRLRKTFGEMSLCPYCHIDTVVSLDHYLPRSAFPEFSLSAQNLVPSCFSCNTIYKKQMWQDRQLRLFVHPYYDILPSSQYLYADVRVQENAVKVGFRISFSSMNALQQVISSHFEKLNLISRYIGKATSEEIPKIHRIALQHSTVADKKRELDNFVKGQVMASEINTWQHALYQALSRATRQMALIL